MLVLAMLMMSVAMGMAQPPGGGYPGGRPGGYPGGPPPTGDRSRWGQDQQQQQQNPQVRQKKSVREGATFKVVGLLRDSLAGTALAYANVAVLDAADSMLIKGTSANANGYFEIDGVPQGDCILRVWFFNYNPLHLPPPSRPAPRRTPSRTLRAWRWMWKETSPCEASPAWRSGLTTSPPN